MRDQHLPKTDSLPGELNHTLVRRGREQILRSNRTNYDHLLTSEAADFYDHLDIGTHDGNHNANWLVDQLDTGLAFEEITSHDL